MRSSAGLWIAIAVAGALGGCSKQTSGYCEAAADDCGVGYHCDVQNRTCVSDATPDGGPQPCNVNADCRGGTPYCDIGSRTCQECGPDEDSQCDGRTPVCNEDIFACRGCELDADCSDSDVCLPDGSCADEEEVLYAAANGTGPPPCLRNAPCSFDVALAAVTAGLNIIKLAAGTYDPPALALGDDVTIVGRGAIVQWNGGSSTPVISIPGHVVKLYYLTIENGDMMSGDGVSCTAGGAVTLHAVIVQQNDGVGVRSVNCEVSIFRSTIAGNRVGGVSVDSGNFSIVNNFIVGNGTDSTAFGGIEVSGTSTMHVVHFNTIVGNDATDSLPAGIQCTIALVPMMFSSNIIFDNDTSSQDQVDATGNCTYAYNNIEQTVAGNLNMAPLFVNAADYHLLPTSPGLGAADPDATLTVDFDGDSRPQPTPGRRDIGADEIP